MTNTINTVITPDRIAWAERRDRKGRSRLAPLLLKMAGKRRLRQRAMALAYKFEHGRFFSRTAREILSKHCGVTVGLYSYGPCLVPGALPPGTVVGRYCSIADGLSIHRRNHPIERLTQHPFLYNSAVGLVPEDTIEKVRDNPLEIGHDVWIGDRVTVLSTCRRIGNGAVIGAGSIVTRDVEPYTINLGIPARPVKARFPAELAERIEGSRWWDLPISNLLRSGDALLSPVTEPLLDQILQNPNA